VFGGGRLGQYRRVDNRRIELEFLSCYHARSGPHGDSEGVEAIGYKIEPVYDGDVNNYLEWRAREWSATGFCPGSGFYVATKSEWLSGLESIFQTHARHYVVDGRDGYVELIAHRFRWREWLWTESHREEAPSRGPVVGSGEGVE